MELFFGTTNPGKLRELRRLVAGLPIRVVSPEDLAAPVPDVVEDGHTFAENAEKKASAFARFSGRHALADDSGLCVDALGGAPGVHSARWSELEPEGPASPVCELAEAGAAELGPVAGRAARDERNNDKLLRALRFGRRGTAAMTFLIALLASVGTLRGHGPFAVGDPASLAARERERALAGETTGNPDAAQPQQPAEKVSLDKLVEKLDDLEL